MQKPESNGRHDSDAAYNENIMGKSDRPQTPLGMQRGGKLILETFHLKVSGILKGGDLGI